MRLNLKTLAGGLVIGLGLATTAPAATLDFVAYAAGTPGDRGGVADGTTIAFDGLNVTFSAQPDGDNVDAVAYFDDLSSNRPAGLGVCSTGLTATAQCIRTDDDNVSVGSLGSESVTLAFDSAVDFMVTSFNDADHFSLANSASTLLIGVNGAAGTSLSFASALMTEFKGITSITFGYDDQSETGRQFYVGGATAVAAVPLPATLPLLAGALGLLGFGANRRRKQAA